MSTCMCVGVFMCFSDDGALKVVILPPGIIDNLTKPHCQTWEISFHIVG